ncbi:MAG: phosphatase PAP2 family protein [Acidobacteriota bacterium]
MASSEVALLVVMLSVSPLLATPQDHPTAGTEPPPDAHLVRRFTGDIRAGLRAPFRRHHHWRRFWLSLTAIGVAAALDNEVRSDVQRNRTGTTDNISDAARPFGSVVPLVGFAATWITGRVRHNNELISIGVDGLEASAITGLLVTPSLKRAVGRARPFQEEGSSSFRPFSGNSSFPAGEPTEAFTAATVVSEHIHKPWVQASAWGAAGLVGLERINLDRHWLSDVTAAGFISHGITRFLVHRHRGAGEHPGGTLASRGSHIQVSPLARGDSRGLLFTFSF